MSTYLVDSHCHLDCLKLKDWENGLDGALEQANQLGIGHFLCVSITLEKYPKMLAMVQDKPNVSVSVGVHPNEQHKHDPSVEELVELANASDKVVAIGETGLDYFRSEGDLDWQRARLRRHIAAAKQVNKPLIIHNRESSEDTLKILREEGADEVGGVMHCFVENWDIAKQAMDLNFMISFSGIVTFKTATELQAVATKLPLDYMLVETDSPYLAPVPFRGKVNQPGYVRYVAEHIAALRGTQVETIAERTTENFFRLFNTARATDSGAKIEPLTDKPQVQ
jgi:TatD DNase family protein